MAEGIDLEAELLTWLRDDLKDLCRQLGLDDSGRAKADIVGRLLADNGHDEHRPATRQEAVAVKTEGVQTVLPLTEPTQNGLDLKTWSVSVEDAWTWRTWTWRT